MSPAWARRVPTFVFPLGSRLARFQTCVTLDCGLRTTIHAGDANECRPEVAADASNPAVKRDFQILIN